MTKTKERCLWCGRVFVRTQGPGRPRRYCRQSCRQRNYEARSRAAELGLSENELVVARDERDALKDRLYVLSCTLEDVETEREVDASRAFEWLYDAAKTAVVEMQPEPESVAD